MKTVLITGGSRGIGRAMVELFAREGYRVAFTYKSSEAEARELSLSTGALAIRADSASESDVTAAVESVISELGKIDCLIYNSAVSSFSLLTDLTLAEWQKTVDTNLTGAFLYARSVIPDMLKRKSGRIINISSMWGVVGASCEVHYSAAKAGLIGFTKALAKELGPSGITVNAIAPGTVNTDMNKHLGESALEEIRDSVPLMRIGEPSEIAAIALFLAGEGASYITGDVINASGGYIT